MSLSAWEQRALQSIENSLAGSDPELTTLLGAFTELVSGEEMPAAEKVTPSWLAFRKPRRLSRRRRLSMQWAMLLLLLLTIISLISVAMAFSRGSASQEGCATPWIASCASPVPAGGSGTATYWTPASHIS